MLFGDWGFESSRLKEANAGGEAALFRPLFILLEAKEVEEISCNRCLKKDLRCLSLGLFCPGSGWDLGQMPLMASPLGLGLLVSPLCAPFCSQLAPSLSSRGHTILILQIGTGLCAPGLVSCP